VFKAFRLESLGRDRVVFYGVVAMRIRKSYGYHRFSDCWLGDCERHYCNFHRTLWSDCETAKEAIEGDRDVINGLHTIIELGECPVCESESRQKLYANG
jgi:hypothetical protein